VYKIVANENTDDSIVFLSNTGPFAITHSIRFQTLDISVIPLTYSYVNDINYSCSSSSSSSRTYRL